MKKLLFLVLAIVFPQLVLAEGVACVSSTPVIDTSAYATGDLMGGKQTLAGLLDPNVGSGHVISVTISDKAAQAIDLDYVLFSQDPTGTTFTDQAAFDPADADLPYMAAPVNLGSSSRFAFSDNSIHHVGSLALPVQVTGTGSKSTLYGALVARGAFTAATASDVTVTVCVFRD